MTEEVKNAISFLEDYNENSRKERKNIVWEDLNERCEKYCTSIETLIKYIKDNENNEKGNKVEE